jgi:isopentenyl-diphosphate Delta-isomerase
MVVLVDEQGNTLLDRYEVIRCLDKMTAHKKGALHRAVSVFIFNNQSKILLQKRAAKKYHSPGKWTNTCCTHPLPSEPPKLAARRRLKEEMELETDLTEVFTFTYKADVGNGMIENEYDHVFIGISSDNPIPDPKEISEWKWVNPQEIREDMERNPSAYTIWFKDCFFKVLRAYENNIQCKEI